MGEAWRAGPLPMLPDDHAPWNEAWSNSIALCASVCDEKPGDLREWLTYYRWLGVDHIYLTENASDNPIKEDIKDFIDSGFVTYRWMDGPHAQMAVFYACLKEHRMQHNWIAFFDTDEFLAVRDKYASLDLPPCTDATNRSGTDR